MNNITQTHKSFKLRFRYFLGSIESTFTFRIQEEREILGFPVERTFSILCPEGKVCPLTCFYVISTFGSIMTIGNSNII